MTATISLRALRLALFIGNAGRNVPYDCVAWSDGIHTTKKSAWLPVAAWRCPAEAAAVDELKQALRELPKDAPTGDAVQLYEQLLEANDRLYEAWATQEMERFPHHGRKDL